MGCRRLRSKKKRISISWSLVVSFIFCFFFLRCFVLHITHWFFFGFFCNKKKKVFYGAKDSNDLLQTKYLMKAHEIEQAIKNWPGLYLIIYHCHFYFFCLTLCELYCQILTKNNIKYGKDIPIIPFYRSQKKMNHCI